jgi:hypothetical protein
VYWFFGDTNRAGYPLGNFYTTGATSSIPALARAGGSVHGARRDSRTSPAPSPTPTPTLAGAGDASSDSQFSPAVVGIDLAYFSDGAVRCTFSKLHSSMPLDPTPDRLKRTCV